MGRSRRRQRASRAVKAGLPPGVPVYVGEAHDEPIHVNIIDYETDRLVELDQCSPLDLARMAAARSITWVNLDGVHEAQRVDELCRAFGVHALWTEDVLNASARPKVEAMERTAMVIARAVRWSEDEQAVEVEHNALIVGPGWLLSFQERPGDAWNPTRERLRSAAGRVRRMPSTYLLHALLDALVDDYFRVLDQVDLAAEQLEDAALAGTARDVAQRIAALKSELGVLRSAVVPLRESVPALLRDPALLSPEVRPYFDDLRDHLDQAADQVEQLRERLVGALEIHLAITNQSLNETMRMLTLVSTLFIPLTFIVGVYGMNFDVMPELRWQWGYAAVWAVMGVVTSGMVAYFRRKGWL